VPKRRTAIRARIRGIQTLRGALCRNPVAARCRQPVEGVVLPADDMSSGYTCKHLCSVVLKLLTVTIICNLVTGENATTTFKDLCSGERFPVSDTKPYVLVYFTGHVEMMPWTLPKFLNILCVPSKSDAFHVVAFLHTWSQLKRSADYIYKNSSQSASLSWSRRLETKTDNAKQSSKSLSETRRYLEKYCFLKRFSHVFIERQEKARLIPYSGEASRFHSEHLFATRQQRRAGSRFISFAVQAYSMKQLHSFTMNKYEGILPNDTVFVRWRSELYVEHLDIWRAIDIARQRTVALLPHPSSIRGPSAFDDRVSGWSLACSPVEHPVCLPLSRKTGQLKADVDDTFSIISKRVMDRAYHPDSFAQTLRAVWKHSGAFPKFTYLGLPGGAFCSMYCDAGAKVETLTCLPVQPVYCLIRTPDGTCNGKTVLPQSEEQLPLFYRLNNHYDPQCSHLP